MNAAAKIWEQSTYLTLKVSSKQLPKLVAIVGPTASGKSELAVQLAKKFNGEIISADSRQVYKYLDMGSNKVPGKWRSTQVYMYKNIPHHCIDFVHPKKTFTVAEYKQCAKKAIADIISRGKLPILTGGTGFYIQAVVDNIIFPEVPPNVVLRKKLEKKTVAQLFGILKKLDPTRAKTIDQKNPRRLMRAIEIATALGTVPQLKKYSPYNTLLICIQKTDTELKQAIQKRSKNQIPGLLKEIRLLLKMKVPKKRIRELGFEYSIPLSYVGDPISDNRRLDLRLLARELAKENWRYAKRQYTWFRHDKRIHWIKTPQTAIPLTKKFLIT